MSVYVRRQNLVRMATNPSHRMSRNSHFTNSTICPSLYFLISQTHTASQETHIYANPTPPYLFSPLTSRLFDFTIGILKNQSYNMANCQTQKVIIKTNLPFYLSVGNGNGNRGHIPKPPFEEIIKVFNWVPVYFRKCFLKHMHAVTNY